MRQYRQLTEDDRIEIYAMKQAGKHPHPLPFDWAWIAPPSTENCNVTAAIAAIGLNRPTKTRFNGDTLPARRSK